jgi:hypothetical protein
VNWPLARKHNRSYPRDEHLWRRSFLLALAAAVPLGSSIALGAPVRGRVRLTRRAVEEDSSCWLVMMTIRLATPPPSAQLPLRFDMEQHVDFEQVGADAGAAVRRVRVSPPLKLAKDSVVDFSDPAGGVSTVGRAELELTRSSGYRAGEWTVQAAGPDGPLGGKVDLTLRGSNPARSPSARNDSPRRWVG